MGNRTPRASVRGIIAAGVSIAVVASIVVVIAAKAITGQPIPTVLACLGICWLPVPVIAVAMVPLDARIQAQENAAYRASGDRVSSSVAANPADYRRQARLAWSAVGVIALGIAAASYLG